MKTKLMTTALGLVFCAVTPLSAVAQIPASITTPDTVETRIGTLEFKDGAPSKATLDKAYDQIDFTHAYDAFVNTMQGVSLVAARRGFLEAGVKDNEILIFSELMDCQVAVPHRQRRHRVLPGLHRRLQGPDGIRGAAQGAGGSGRHVVPLGHGFRLARP